VAKSGEKFEKVGFFLRGHQGVGVPPLGGFLAVFVSNVAPVNAGREAIGSLCSPPAGCYLALAVGATAAESKVAEVTEKYLPTGDRCTLAGFLYSGGWSNRCLLETT
jgi:hypothetical protein